MMDPDEKADRMAAREAEHINAKGFCTDCGGFVLGGNMGHFADCPHEKDEWNG